MAQQGMAQQAHTGRFALSGAGIQAGIAPEIAVRLVGALLAVAVAAVHITDQGGLSALAAPTWIGWSYRLIEVGGVLTALALVLPVSARLGRPWLGWAAGVLLGAGPFLAYVTSRTVGLPGDSGDIGNWGYWVGIVSLIVESALVVLSTGMLLGLRPRGPVALPSVAFGGVPLVAGRVLGFRPADVHDLDGQVAGRAEDLVGDGRAVQQPRPA
jgi:hypothetical protein